MGIYLGQSSQHARSVALVLNLTTGHVSPQFHIKFDPLFHTTSEEERPPSSLWQTKAGFVSQSEGVKQRADSVKTVTFQLAAGSDIPRSQEIPPPSEGDRTSAVAPAEGRAPTYRLRAQSLLQRGTSTESQTTKFPLPAAKAGALAPPAEGGRLHKG